MSSKNGFEKPNEKKRILIVDPHPVFRQGLTDLINSHSDLVVCGEADNANVGLSHVDKLKPNLVVASLALKRSIGMELIKDIKIRHPSIPVLVLSVHDESLFGERVLRAGAKGYIMKTESGDEILSAIRHVLIGRIHLSHEMGTLLLSGLANGRAVGSESVIDRLSDRELEVLQLLGRAYETRQIAEMLHVSVKTVESYREHIKSKFKLENSTQLIHEAVKWVLTAGLG